MRVLTPILLKTLRFQQDPVADDTLIESRGCGRSDELAGVVI